MNQNSRAIKFIAILMASIIFISILFAPSLEIGLLKSLMGILTVAPFAASSVVLSGQYVYESLFYVVFLILLAFCVNFYLSKRLKSRIVANFLVLLLIFLGILAWSLYLFSVWLSGGGSWGF